MLQDMDPMEARCILDVKVGMLDHVEPRQMCVLTVTSLGIAMLSIQLDSIFSLRFM